MNHRTCILLAAALGLLLAPSVRAQDAAPTPPAATTAPVAVAAPATAPAIEDVSLYLAPDASQAVVKSVKADDPRLAAAKPVADATQAAAGWQTLDLKDAFIGYAPINTSRKDLSIQPGTPIRQSPDANSPVLGQASLDPLTTIQAIEVDWAQVNYPGPATVYFQKAASAAALPATAAAAQAVTPVTPVTPVASAPAPAKPNTISPDVPRYFSGIFKQRTDLKISGPINAQYVLVSPNGQVVALVDMNNVILASPITTYLNKPVRVFGTAIGLSNPLYVFVRAQFLQLN